MSTNWPSNRRLELGPTNVMWFEGPTPAVRSAAAASSAALGELVQSTAPMSARVQVAVLIPFDGVPIRKLTMIEADYPRGLSRSPPSACARCRISLHRSLPGMAAVSPSSASEHAENAGIPSKMGLIICWHKRGAVVYALAARRPRRDIRSPSCQIPGVRSSARDTAMCARSLAIKSSPPIGSIIVV
jgi:hypothetical protein